jgi:hypothetical protein
MSVGLTDLTTGAVLFRVNFWHWGAIVEAVRRLRVLRDDRVDQLREPFVGELSEEEARAVGAAIRKSLLPVLGDDDRLLLDGRRTTEPLDPTFYTDPAEQHKNYSTDRRVLEEFAACCEMCNGFRVA